MHGLEVVHDEEARIVQLSLWRLEIGAVLEGGHAVVSLHDIVDGCNTVVALRVYRLSVELCRHELAVLGDDQLHPVADALTAFLCHLAEEFHHLVAFQGDEGNLVFKRGNVVDVAVGHCAFRQGCTYAAYVVHAEVGLLAVVLACPDEDVAQQVGNLAFRRPLVHVAGCHAHHGAHHRVHLLPVGGNKGFGGSVGLLVVAAVYDYPAAADARQLVVRRAACGRRKYSSQDKKS